jgi:hypothetical protein
MWHKQATLNIKNRQFNIPEHGHNTITGMGDVQACGRHTDLGDRGQGF